MNPTKEWGFFLFNFFTNKILKINIFCAMDIFIWKNLIFYGRQKVISRRSSSSDEKSRRCCN
jgi:hypothetical protein